jgi:hypothetical protein
MVAGQIRQRRDRLCAGRQFGQSNTFEGATNCGGVPVMRGRRSRRLQANRTQDVAPCFGAVVFRVGFTGERTEAHASTFIAEAKQPPCHPEGRSALPCNFPDHRAIILIAEFSAISSA